MISAFHKQKSPLPSLGPNLGGSGVSHDMEGLPLVGLNGLIPVNVSQALGFDSPTLRSRCYDWLRAPVAEWSGTFPARIGTPVRFGSGAPCSNTVLNSVQYVHTPKSTGG